MLIDYHAPSAQIAGGCWWHRPWDEQTQAEYVEKVYTIVFSRALAMGIDWGTDVADDTSAKAGGLACGLLSADSKPKPAYFALKNLINSWTTSGTGKTDEDGKFEFRGFAGDYELTLKATDGQSFSKVVHVNEQQTSEVTIESPVGTRIELQQPPPIEKVPPSEGNGFSLIAGTIGGIVVLGLLTLFMVRKRSHWMRRRQ